MFSLKDSIFIWCGCDALKLAKLNAAIEQAKQNCNQKRQGMKPVLRENQEFYELHMHHTLTDIQKEDEVMNHSLIQLMRSDVNKANVAVQQAKKLKKDYVKSVLRKCLKRGR